MSFISTILQRGIQRSQKLLSSSSLSVLKSRSYPALPKRFYKNTDVIYSDGVYEVLLDKRKLKTPLGQPFQIESEMLALAVAQEWNSQKDVIQRSNMHLTALCSTAIDNPNHLNKVDSVNQIISFLETDTILYFSENEEVLALQEKEWRPVIKWFCERFDVKLEPTTHITTPTIPERTKETVVKHLLSYNFSAVQGFSFAVESLKSVILALACAERKLSTNQAVLLSRLEEEYQAGSWGRVEWAHDVSQLDLQARVAAATLFIHVNSMSEETKSKLARVV